ncbi:tautomerase family protein [Rhizobium sp. AG207R]|uniref:tautomerase family protein n=1 Tax=Rhizobium sp. AG207R TaxID=2802287 RepID=UPI0022AC001A|nr:tautomerase family protein [Rhizobium sp. AG207R]MCZ3380560.1 tautomerase family protein [Rhizobium sp. AG207R]
MPKMFVHSSKGTFSPEARSKVANSLTNLGIECERLLDSEKIKRGVWVFFSEHDSDSIFSGGEAVSTPQIALVTYAIRGGLDEETRKVFITEATAILSQHADPAQTSTPTYVVIQETPEVDWGMYGKQVDLATMQKSA